MDHKIARSDPNGFRIFTKYDILGRVILTGKHTTSSNPTGSEQLYETASGSGYFYTSSAFPTSSIEVYTVKYYDDYDWEDNGSNDATYRGGYADYLSANYPWVKGKLTRSKNGRLNQNGTAPSNWMDDIIFYDIEGREIQKQSLQQLGYVDTTWRQYDFPGRLKKTQWFHMNNTTRTLITERFEYDHAGRLVETFHKIGTQAEQKIYNQSYNERDELSQKQSAYSGGNYGQSIDYTYNIRKWLTQINDPASCGADLFSEKLGYTDANASLGATAKYNGNIAWIEWRTGANCTVGGLSRNKAGYGFIYDGLDRMTGSMYGENTGSWTNLNRYNENLTYDLNGNILTLGRRGYISAGKLNINYWEYTKGKRKSGNEVKDAVPKN